MKAYAITDIGKKRSFNQDYAWMTTDEIGKLPNLFIVADGMGGHRGGGYASRLAVETILEQIRQSQADSPAEILVDAIRHANECIRQTAAEDEQLSGMGTTVVAARTESAKSPEIIPWYRKWCALAESVGNRRGSIRIATSLPVP